MGHLCWRDVTVEHVLVRCATITVEKAGNDIAADLDASARHTDSTSHLGGATCMPDL